jgi:Superfamily II DNA/RNA helicases, SNF2 family
MAKLERLCPTCGKKADEASHTILKEFSMRIVSLKCGHSYTEKLLKQQPWEEIVAQFGKQDKLYQYQGIGYEFCRAAGFRALIADEPGLGKTLQTLACLKLHSKELTPCLIVVKAALKLQYFKAIIRWLGMDFMPNIIETSEDKPIAGYPITLVTYDMLWRMSKRAMDNAEKSEAEVRMRLGLDEWEPIPDEERHNIPEIKNHLKDFGFKTIILDECQQIKNPASKRAQMVRELCKDIPHILASSGTPIKNNAGEYFTILNILRPEKFRNYKQYLLNYCDTYWNGRAYKVGGIRDIEWFREATKDFIIRRTKAEVLPDLPKVEQKFQECDFASDRMKREYEDMQQEFSDYFYENENEADAWTNILAKMAKLRHKAGINKIPFATEFVIDFLLDTERSRKIVIFTHHHDVMDMMKANLVKRMKEENLDLAEPLCFQAGNMQKRNQVLEDFKNLENCRVLIASTLAAGEGVDGLQEVCNDCIILERQWNPANEKQVEDRFSRIGSKFSSVSANYILSTGTIDEYFTELVEQKRAIIDQTLDGKDYQWNEQGLMKELAATLARKGAKKWRL